MTHDAPFPLHRVSRAGWCSVAGLLVGILGLVVQAVAEPAKFAGTRLLGVPFPPGILVILGAGLLMLATCRWRWYPVFGVLVGVWIVGVGGRFLVANLASPVVGTVAGNVVMAAGLVAAVIGGIVAIAAPGRRRVADDRAAAGAAVR